jgi:hypothetical protein
VFVIFFVVRMAVVKDVEEENPQSYRNEMTNALLKVYHIVEVLD